MPIRNAAKAIIIDNSKILLNKCFDDNAGEYYCLPGGGQNQYETMSEAVIRECLEETGYTVIPEQFSAIFEIIYDNKNSKDYDCEYTHKIYHIFKCILNAKTQNIPTELDKNQLGCEWVFIKDLQKYDLHPPILNKNINLIIDSKTLVFLGSERVINDRSV